MVRWNDYQSVSVFDFFEVPPIREHSITRITPRIRLVRGRGEVWKGTLMVADLEQVDKIDASEFHHVKVNAKDMISHQIGDNSQKPQMDNLNLLAEIRF